MDRTQIAQRLRAIGGFLRLKDENPFKVRAYENAAEAIEDTLEDVAALVRDERLTQIPGIGRSVAAIITELHTTGTSKLLDELRGDMPPGVLDLMQIRGLTLHRIRMLYETLGIASIEDLRAAIERKLLRGLKGIGAKTEETIGQALHRHLNRPARILLVDAHAVGAAILSHMRGAAGGAGSVEDVALGGSIRRWNETVGTITVVAAARDVGASLQHFLTMPTIARVEAQTPSECIVHLADGARVRCQAVAPERYATALLLATGSSTHVARLHAQAHARKVDLATMSVPDEESLYRALGLPYVPPEMREDTGEIQAALGGDDFADLVAIDDVQGMIHCHTVYSDGKNTIEEMALAAEALGMKYLTITDHSPTATYASGVAVDRLKQQWDEIAAVQERVSVRLLRGTESDILEDGALDYPDAILESFDVIIASIHSRMKMDSEQMTRRLVAAMRQPVFKIWGHALGRLVLRRDPIACDVPAVLDAIAGSRAAIEVNGDPYRLDLEPRWIREARKRKIPFVISTDAHSIQNLHNLAYGVAMARRGGLRRGEVLNTLSPAAFAAAVRPVSRPKPEADPESDPHASP